MSSMSKIEDIIQQIYDYIDGCKYQAFSNTKIIVDREEMDILLEELRARTPEEIRHYQEIIASKDEILNDARKKAEALINDATIHTNELINEHAIMQQAYTQANEMVQLSTQQAQDILDRAVAEANAYRTSASQYMDGMLAQLEDLTAQTMTTANAAQNTLIGSLGEYLNTIRQNRQEMAVQAAQQQQEALQADTEAADNLVEEAEAGAKDAVQQTTQELKLI
ncbi:MAG: vacuolar family H+-ATPase subunit H [Lachnospiraceae bacterium]|nr:vacuolar family H+-ATPase subunit H [Lachnospiraceae bacterium]